MLHFSSWFRLFIQTRTEEFLSMIQVLTQFVYLPASIHLSASSRIASLAPVWMKNTKRLSLYQRSASVATLNALCQVELQRAVPRSAAIDAAGQQTTVQRRAKRLHGQRTRPTVTSTWIASTRIWKLHMSPTTHMELAKMSAQVDVGDHIPWTWTE